MIDKECYDENSFSPEGFSKDKCSTKPCDKDKCSSPVCKPKEFKDCKEHHCDDEDLEDEACSYENEYDEELNKEKEKNKNLETSINTMKVEFANSINDYKQQMEGYKKATQIDINILNKKFSLILIEIIDMLKYLLLNTEDEKKEGVEMALGNVKDKLNSFGVTAMTNYDILDPRYHEVIGIVNEKDKPNNKITSVKTQGYLIGDFIVRTAQVIVNKIEEEIPH